MFNSLAQYFLGTTTTASNSTETPTTNNQANHLDPQNDSGEQLAKNNNSRGTVQEAITITTAKRGKRRNRNKNKDKNLCESVLNVTARVCEDEEEWIFVECTQRTNKKNGIITLHGLDDVEITCLPEDSEELEPPQPRFEIKNNPLNLNQQQLRRLHQQNAVLISCDDIKDDDDFFRGSTPDKQQVINIEATSPAVVNGNSSSGHEKVTAPKLAAVPEANAAAKKPNSMEESWFVTPPSCFTSQGPIHMETSPLENLLIEHPSMSVYHDAPNAENIDEDLVVVLGGDFGAEQQQLQVVPPSPVVERTPTHNERIETTAPRTDRNDYICNREVKQGLLFRNAQMNHDKKMRQKLCRNVMTRSNKSTEMNAKAKKRSEKQHAKNASRANNNRKC